MKKYILALDEGTTSTRAILFDRKGNIVSKSQKEFTQRYPAVGWVEHDASEIYASQYAVMTEAIISAGIAPEEIGALGITNQRETVVVWNKHTGRPVCNAIVWQCRRTLDFCEKLKADGYEKMIREKTGLPIDAYFSASKIRWILDHTDGAAEAAARGELLCGTMDTWLIWNLTKGKVHATDLTNASRTMLFLYPYEDVGRGADGALRHSAQYASRGQNERRRLRQRQSARGGNTDLRRCGRPAIRAFRSGVL